MNQNTIADLKQTIQTISLNNRLSDEEKKTSASQSIQNYIQTHDMSNAATLYELSMELLAIITVSRDDDPVLNAIAENFADITNAIAQPLNFDDFAPARIIRSKSKNKENQNPNVNQ
jgi:hypothetical protein